jgi:prophage regulatory protein
MSDTPKKFRQDKPVTEAEKVRAAKKFLEVRGYTVTADKAAKPPKVEKPKPVLQPRFLRVAQIAQLTGYSIPSVWRKAKEGTFPQPQKIGANSTAWKAEEIEAWIASGGKSW